MEKGQTVFQHTSARHRWGVVLSTRIDPTNKWKYCKVQWTSSSAQVLGDITSEEEVRVDEVTAINPLMDFESIQKAITLSAAVKDENYAKVLKEVAENVKH